MLSRAYALPKFNSLIRQITSSSLSLNKPVQFKAEIEENNAQSHQSNTKPELSNTPKVNQQAQQKFKNLNKNETNIKIKNLYQSKPKVEISLESITDTRYKEIYKNIIDSFNNNLNSSYQNLILPCQQMNELYELESKIAENFCSDPLKTKIINILFKNIEKMKTKEFFQSSQFILRFEPAKFDLLKPHLDSNSASLDIGQLLKLVLMMRTPSIFKMQTLDTIRNFTNLIRDRLDEIDNLANIKLAMKLYAQEQLIIKKLDNKLLKLSDSLTSNDWVDILNTKSIYRQRNLVILESCAFNLINKKGLGLDSIQKCLLSCGILNYHDSQFYKFLLESLNDELKKNESNQNYIKFNFKNLLSIINSIGILQLRDDNLLKTLNNCLLKSNFDQKSKLIINFIISLASLNYSPENKNDLKQLNNSVSLSDFDLNDKKEKVNMLNYVWSLCCLDIENKNLIEKVLNNSYWNSLLDKESKDLKPNLLKLLNINLYSILNIEDYQGPNLPDDFNIEQYSSLLVPKDNNVSDMFVSALSSFRTIEKYVKLNLLTPFGILIDALMIVDKNGIPCQLNKFFNQNSALETGENELKVAFKQVGFRDQTQLNKNVNGILGFQLKLLKELGYNTILVTQEELQSTSLINRANLIQNKLKKLVKN